MLLQEKLYSLTKGKLEETIDDIVYEDLEQYIDGLSIENAILTMNHLFEYNFSKLQDKIVRVAFLVYSSSEWQCEAIYRAMESDPYFDPSIIICGYLHGTEESIRNTYINTCRYFRKRKYNVLYMGYSKRWLEREVLNDFDIIFYIIPYRSVLIPYSLNVEKQSITKILIHVPYGLYLVEPRKNYVELSPLFKMCWKCYAANELEKIYLSDKQRLNGYNIVAAGESKADYIRCNCIKSNDNIWKKGDTRIIWAPHFNLDDGMNGTFHENYMFLYNYAENHKDISWIVKPHPRMEWGVLEFGVFNTSEEYRNYLDMWQVLPNARVIEDEDYMEAFVTSDALIHDSLTFMAEYMMTGHQQLRLLPQNPRPLNIAGKKIAQMIRSVRGNDYKAIEYFIEDIKEKCDEGIEERKHFIDQYMSGEARKKGISCARYIVEDIKKNIESGKVKE